MPVGVFASLERAANVLAQGEGFAGAGSSAPPIIEKDFCLPTLPRAWCGLFESRSGKLKIEKKLCRR